MKLNNLPSNFSLLGRAFLTISRKNNMNAESMSFEKTFLAKPIDQAKLVKYNQLFRRNNSIIPLTFLYFMSQRAQVALMLDKRVGFSIPGLIHTDNELSLVNLPDLHLPWKIDSHLRINRVGEHDRIQIVLNSRLNQDNKMVASCKSIYQVLNKNKDKKKNKNKAVNNSITNFSKEQCELWAIDSGMGLRYARISGDYNPIHLYKSTAKIFGFRLPIIHGMYSHSRIVDTLEHHFEKSIKNISISFRKPIFLPSNVRFEFEVSSEEQGQFRIVSNEREQLYLQGNYCF